jgi:hypothetical protein
MDGVRRMDESAKRPQNLSSAKSEAESAVITSLKVSR